MYGIIFPIMAGVLISLQSVFVTRVTEKIGLWETNTLVHLFGLIATLFFLFLQGDGSFKKLNEVSLLYLTGCFFGAIIVFGIIKGVSSIGPTLTIAISLITQLAVACLVDCTGSFGVAQVRFDFTKLIGIILMAAGIVVFKIKG